MKARDVIIPVASLAALSSSALAEQPQPFANMGKGFVSQSVGEVRRDISFQKIKENFLDHLGNMPESRGAQVHQQLQGLMRPFIEQNFPRHAKMQEVDYSGISEAVQTVNNPQLDKKFSALTGQMLDVIDGKPATPSASAKTVLTPAQLKHTTLGNLEPHQVSIKLDTPPKINIALANRQVSIPTLTR